MVCRGGAGLRGCDTRSSLRRLVAPVRVELLGAGLPATALPIADGNGPAEPALLYFGIIDFLQVKCFCVSMCRRMGVYKDGCGYCGCADGEVESGEESVCNRSVQVKRKATLHRQNRSL